MSIFIFHKLFATQLNEGKKDWVKEYEIRENEGLKYGDIKSYFRNKDIVNIFSKFSNIKKNLKFN